MGVAGRDWATDPRPEERGGVTATIWIVSLLAVLWLVVAAGAGRGTLPRGLGGSLLRDLGFWTQQVWAEPWRLFTAGLLHQPKDLGHVLAALLPLALFGSHLERRRGRGALVGAVVGGSFVHYLLLAVWTDATPTHTPSPDALRGIVGIQGGTCAVLVATWLGGVPRERRTFLFWDLDARHATLLWGGVTLLFCAFLTPAGRAASPGPLVVAMLAGGAFGFLVHGRPFRSRRPVAPPGGADAASPPPSPPDDDEELDRLLAKISAEGMEALTPAEREALDAASRRRR